MCYSIVPKYLVLSYLLFCKLFCALALFPNQVRYHDFAYTTYASELLSIDNNLGEDTEHIELPEQG
jgi:hypothetical protein